MLDKGLLEGIGRRLSAHRAARRDVITASNDALNASKRAIFSLHRDDVAGADALLSEAAALLATVRDAAKTDGSLGDEGSYRAALEEFVEASLYRHYVADGSVGAVDIAGVTDEIYLSGLADLCGELQRRQVQAATAGKLDEVGRIKELIAMVVESYLAMDLSGYLRTKFDQMKNALRRAEDVLYEITLRRG